MNIEFLERSRLVANSTGCLTIGGKVVFGFGVDCLKIWNRVDRGRFTIQDQKGKEIGRVAPKLSTISW